MTTTTEHLADRYGAPAPWRGRLLRVSVVVVVVAFAGWLAWTVYEQSTPKVSSEMQGFQVVDASSATARVQLQFSDKTVQATCVLKAYAADHTLVGELDFHPDPYAIGNIYTETVNTERLATSVESIGCTADGQPRPR